MAELPKMKVRAEYVQTRVFGALKTRVEWIALAIRDPGDAKLKEIAFQSLDEIMAIAETLSD
jgi:hypothetical protein